jgi:hypothetical protein
LSREDRVVSSVLIESRELFERRAPGRAYRSAQYRGAVGESCKGSRCADIRFDHGRPSSACSRRLLSIGDEGPVTIGTRVILARDPPRARTPVELSERCAKVTTTFVAKLRTGNLPGSSSSYPPSPQGCRVLEDRALSHPARSSRGRDRAAPLSQFRSEQFRGEFVCCAIQQRP